MNYRSNIRSRGYQPSMQNKHFDYVKQFHQVQSRNGYENCGKVNVPDGVISLAMVYTVPQCWKNITDGCTGLERGTVFDELNKPFKGYTCKRGGCSR